jgi:hypothetical protein
MSLAWRRARFSLLLAVAALAGCAAALERSHVARRFSTIFQCDDSQVRRESGGYVVEGCGVSAHFTCFDSDDDWESLAEPGSTGALIGGIVDGATGRDTCILEHSEHVARAVEVAPPVQRKQAQAGVTIETRLMFAGGHLVALGKPAQHPEHALLLVHTALRRLAPSPCQAALYHDGAPVPIERLERTGDHDARLLIRVASLAESHRSVRFAGSVCGAEFDLDDASRQALGLFHARFSEALSRGAQRLASGGEQAVGPAGDDPQRPPAAKDAVP